MSKIMYTIHEGFLKRHAKSFDEAVTILQNIGAGHTYYVTDSEGKYINPIRFEMAGLYEEIDKLQAKEAGLREHIEKLQKICPHDEGTLYTPDPSGNNDDGYTCLICGADI